MGYIFHHHTQFLDLFLKIICLCIKKSLCVSCGRWTLWVRQPSVWFSPILRPWMIFRRNALSWTRPGAAWWDALISARTNLATRTTCSASSVTSGEGRERLHATTATTSWLNCFVVAYNLTRCFWGALSKAGCRYSTIIYDRFFSHDVLSFKQSQ